MSVDNRAGEKRKMEQKKEEVKRIKEAKRIEKEKAKAQKQALNTVSKGMKKENWMEYMTIWLDQSLVNNNGGVELLTTLELEGLQCKSKIQPLPGTVTFTRTVLKAVDGEVIRDEVSDSTVVLVLQADDIANHITNNNLMTFTTAATSILTVTPTFIIRGLAKLMKSKIPVSRLKWEEEMLALQFEFNISCYYIDKSGELSEHLRMFCKAVAHRPHKQNKDLYIDVGKENVHVDKDGKGLIQVWTKQLQDIRHVSEAVASAITTLYPSPRLLIGFLDEAGGNAVAVLADINVRRGVGSLASNRRVGPEAAKRIVQYFTSTNPDELIS